MRDTVIAAQVSLRLVPEGRRLILVRPAPCKHHLGRRTRHKALNKPIGPIIVSFDVLTAQPHHAILDGSDIWDGPFLLGRLKL